MNKIFNSFLFLMTLIVTLVSCHQSDPPPYDPNPMPVDSGDIFFSGYGWTKKGSGFPVGPGPNYFSATENNVFLDANGYLHLKITKENNQWKAAEVISTANMGYGTYVFTVAGNLTTFNEKVVLGLFTWDNNTFYEQGNSEVDIEFSRWNNPDDTLLLTYAVQPVIFDNPTIYQERTLHPVMPVSLLKETTTHVFTWRSDLITWASYQGEVYPGSPQIASWSFDLTNQPRTKIEGGQTSLPIIIPAPGQTTNARMNLWLLGGQAPTNNLGTEVVIKSFRYIPL